jgi:two-component system sensor histidine kinase KdpD
LAFDFFFVPPRLTFAVADTQYLLTFLGLFVVGVVISSLVAKARERADAVRIREVQTASLYYLSRDLAAAVDIAAVLRGIVKNFGESLSAQVALFLPEGERLELMASSDGLELDINDQAVADWAFRNRQPAGRGSNTLVSADLLYLPLQSAANVLGVMGVRLDEDAEYTSPETRRLLDAFATQIAMALERVQLSHQAEQAQILQARENLERALLNSISHDLRTPLVTITGVLSSVLDEGDRLNEKARLELLATAREEAGRLNRFVGNLLDMTRLEAGAISLKKEPCDVQDLIGCALAAIEPRLGGRPVQVNLPPDVPLVALDMVLMNQVVVNLLDNAIKYSPPESALEITARFDARWLTIEVADRGSGVPEQDLQRIFDKFFRLPIPEGAGGTGLGLSICKGIVEAHGGTIRAENRTGGGLIVTVDVPTDAPYRNQDEIHGR